MTTPCTPTMAFDRAVNVARQTLYRFTALSLLDPKFGSWERLDKLWRDRLLLESAEIINDLPHAVCEELGRGERRLTDLDPQRVLDRLPFVAHEFNTEYENTLGQLVSPACPPYETEYIDSKFAFQRSNALADISGFYRAFGLTTSDENPERVDHIVQELEFMAFLVGHERLAAGDDSSEHKEHFSLCRAAQKTFLQDHLAWWTPTFARLLSRENPGGFYAAAGVFLAALIPAERAILGVEVTTYPVMPNLAEQPEACEGCQLL